MSKTPLLCCVKQMCDQRPANSLTPVHPTDRHAHDTAHVLALAAVVTGEADAALADHVSALMAAGEGSGLVIVEKSVVEELYAVAVHRESRQLLRAINEAMAEMEADGTLEALAAEWLEGE